MVGWGNFMQTSRVLIRQLNLLPDEVIHQQRLDKIRQRVGYVLLLLAGLLLIVQGQLQHKVDYLELELVNIQPLAAQTHRLQDNAKQLRAQLNHEEKRQHLLNLQTSIDPIAHLTYVETIMPTSGRILQIDISTTHVSVAGQATSLSDIALLLDKLQLRLGSAIRLSTCHLTSNDQYYFQIEGEVARP
jgi:hypothetical protein